MGPLTIGFDGKNYIFSCREFKIHDKHLKLGIVLNVKEQCIQIHLKALEG